MTASNTTPAAPSGGGTSIRVSLVLLDIQESPDGITRFLGMTPSKAGEKGERHRSVTGRMTSQVYKYSFWAVDSTMDPSAGLEDQVRCILEMVEPVAAGLVSIGPPVKKRFYCTVIPDDAMPLLELRRETLQRLAALGCDLIVDIVQVDSE